MGEYRRTYQQKFMQVRKNKDNKKLAQDFETWKKQAKEKINQMKKGKLTENEVYDWIRENKQFLSFFYIQKVSKTLADFNTLIFC